MRASGGDIKEGWHNIVDKVSDKTADMKAKVATKWNDIKENWGSKLTDKIKDKTASMKAKIGSTWNSLKGSWQKLTGNFKDKTVSVKAKVSGVVDNVKGWLNEHFVDKINGRLPKWFPKIPRLASGGVLYDTRLVMAGEYSGARTNPEIVTPQNIMRETFEDVMSDFATNNNKNEGAIKQLVIQFGSYRVANEMENLLRKAQRMNGTATVTV